MLQVPSDAYVFVFY